MPRPIRWLRNLTVLFLLLLTFAAGWIAAKVGIGSAMDPVTLPERERQFVELMRDATMIGYFTVDGREDRKNVPDRYDLSSVEKVGDDRWRFNARIGELNVSVPVTVTMRWVEDTPIIMLNDLTIPTIGTFSARVFFHGNRYSGTWQHGSVGGYMYGRVERR